MADLPDGAFDGLHFDEEVADFFKKVMKVIGAKHVREARGFQMNQELAAGCLWDQVQDADASTLRSGNTGKLAQDDEGVTIDSRKHYIGNHERPFPGFQLRKEHLGVRDDADAPSLGIQNLFDRTRALGIVVQDENANLLWGRRRTSTHNTKSIR